MKQATLSLIRNSRITRQLHALLFFFFGASLACPHCSLNAQTVLAVVLQTFFLCHFVILTNDIADIDLDIHAEHDQDRPLVSGAISLSSAALVSCGCFSLALAIAVSLGCHAVTLSLAIAFLYTAYSMPPFRLKRVPLLSKLIVAACSLVYAFYGFVSAGGGDSFPRSVALHILSIGSLVMNLIDLKDVKADAASGIMTLPVLFGTQCASWIIAISFVIADVTLPLLLHHTFLAIIVAPFVAALEAWLLLVRKPFNEPLLMAVYLLSLALLTVTHFVSTMS